MASIKLSKNEIKKSIREELLCDYGFILHLTKWGMIQKLQDAYADPNESDAYSKEVMDEIHETYKDYCNAWELDYQADNRKNTDYRKRVNPLIPPLTEERKAELKAKKKK